MKNKIRRRNAVDRRISWIVFLPAFVLQVPSICLAAEPPAVLDALLERSRQLERAKSDADRRPPVEANVRCGPWHAIGPFKDAEYGLFSRGFETPLGPEADVIARGARPADLKRVYDSVPVVGMPRTERHWRERPQWTDGYFHLLPTGPPPSRNETVYLYRTVTADIEVTVPAKLVATDAVKVWLNGQQVADGPIRRGAGHRLLHLAFDLPLKSGENRLLVKIVSCFQKHGFSFTIPGLLPEHPWWPGKPRASDARAFTAAYQPFASALHQANRSVAAGADPPWYVKRDTWRETLIASRAAKRKATENTGSLPYCSPVFRNQDKAKHLRLNVSGLDKLVLACTVGGDDYAYDDNIWADPKLIAPDGREVWLTDLRPAKSRVGYLRLFVNENLSGKRLKIGGKEFERGFWAHAPSVLEFHLDGKYKWFDTWIGLDKLAAGPGSSEFLVTDSSEMAELALSQPGLDALLDALIQRDFAGSRRAAKEGLLVAKLAKSIGGQPKVLANSATTGMNSSAARLSDAEQMQRELADGIWDGIDSLDHSALVRARYRAAILRAIELPESHATVLDAAETVEQLSAVCHGVKRFQESLAKVRGFRFRVEPLPMYEPPVLKMQEGLASISASAGGARYLGRLASVRTRAESALVAYEAGKPEAVELLATAAASIERFRVESIRELGPIVFVRHPSFGRINAPDPYEAPGKAPASIAVFDPAQPDRPPRVIYDDPDGSIFNMSLSYDAQTVFFSAKRKDVPGGWHIYEIGIDGRNLRQITDGDGNDISPLLLPSGRIMFVSNRAGNVLVCQPGRAGVLYVCERDGSEVRRVSGHTLSDHTPQMMDDGRVMFTRWDYGVDKGVFQRQGVWTMNPDGSRLQLFFGNTILDPNSFWQAYPVPGRPEVVSTFGGHHSGPYGVIGLIWNRLGPEAPRGEGFRWLTPEYPTYYDDNFYHGYMDPFPVNEHQFLVSYGGDGNRRSRIYLMDDRGNKHCIWEEAELGCYLPILLRPRRKPPVLTSSSEPRPFVYVDPVEANRNPGDQTGAFLLSDVYQGLQPHVTRGEVKAIQILEQVPKTRPHTGGYAWNVTPTIGRGTFYVRRLIGTVPVEDDGSAHFGAPARRDISFNLLDEEGRVLQKMGSTTQVMPGETQSCIGCHESRASTVRISQTAPLAARRKPSVPKRPDWGTGGIIDYVKVVQPVWDKYCIRCHSGPRPDGNFDLSGDKTRYFNMSYNMLIDRGFVHHIPMNGADHDLTTPKANGSLASRLLPFIEGDHGDVTVSREDRQRVYTWIDANVPYYHTYLYTDGTVNGARDRWYDDRPDYWFRKDFAPVFMRRCYGCHRRTVDISDAWLGRSIYEVSSKLWTDTTLMDQGLHIENAIRTFGPAHRINLTHPKYSQMLTAPLAEEAGGLGLCKDKDGTPLIFKDRNDSDYQTMLEAIRRGHETLMRHPRVDMVAAEE